MHRYTAKNAVLSLDMKYRYVLRRDWGEAPEVMFVMLNPSTADALKDDATVRKCVGFADAAGHGGLIICNLFALRSRDPGALISG